MSERKLQAVEYGLETLGKQDGASIRAEHDQIWLGGSCDTMPPEHVKVRLEELGWWLDEGVGWSLYV